MIKYKLNPIPLILLVVLPAIAYFIGGQPAAFWTGFVFTLICLATTAWEIRRVRKIERAREFIRKYLGEVV